MSSSLIQLSVNEVDLRLCWMEAAKTVDQTNLDVDDGVPATCTCDCDDARSNVELHCCQRCTWPVLCVDQAFDSNRALNESISPDVRSDLNRW